MTFKEKAERERSDAPIMRGPGLYNCPYMYGYEGERICINATERDCEACWNREIPGAKERPHILDSGERRQFGTGAVRDIQEGKGRCDLMPLEVAGKWLKDDVLGCIACFKATGDTTNLYGALNYFLSKAGWTPYQALLEVSKHFEEGAKKYGEDNWQKGIPVHCYIDSMTRHYNKFMCGMKDEPHNRAFVWNLLCCIWEVDFSPRAKMNGMPVAEEAPAPEVNSDRFYICNRKPCEVCYSDCHCTEGLDDAAVLELSDRDVRYEDCPIGLFMCDSDGVFLKTELVDAETGLNTAIHIGLGLSRKFKADDLVCPIKYPFEERERV